MWKKINNRDRCDFFAALQILQPLRNQSAQIGVAVRIRCEPHIPLWHLSNAEKVARHREQARSGNRRGYVPPSRAATTTTTTTRGGRGAAARHPCTTWCARRSHTHTTSCRTRTCVRSCVPRVITGFRRGNAPAMADPPAYSRGGIQAFGHSGDAHRHTRCVPVTPLISTPIKHPLVKETGGGPCARREGPAAAVRFPAIRSLSHAMRYRALLLRVIATHAMAVVLRERGRNLRGKRTRGERIA